jgi:hypothetical protein
MLQRYRFPGAPRNGDVLFVSESERRKKKRKEKGETGMGENAIDEEDLAASDILDVISSRGIARRGCPKLTRHEET